MGVHLIPIPVVLALTVVYWVARRQNDLRTVRWVQPGLTILLIVTAALGLFAPGARLDYTLWIIAGLAVALIGDFNNVDMNDQRTVLIGLALFVVAYLTYAVGLTALGGFHKQDVWVAVVLLAIYALVISVLWKGLGEMRIPVLIYALVLPSLVWRAVGTFFGDSFSTTQAILLSAGALALYIGDLEYGIHRFRWPIPMYFGPALYAGGQTCFALSTAYFSSP